MIIIMLMIIVIIIIIIKIVVMIMIIIIHNSPLQIVLSEIQILFAQLIIGPAATEQRQIDITLSLSIVERQINREAAIPNLSTSFGMTRPAFEPTTSRL